MEENKEIKVSLSTIFLVIAIILIIVMGALLYMQKIEADRQIAELESNASKLQETINDLQGKIDNISNTINGTTEEIKFDTTIDLKEIESLDYSNKSQLKSFNSKYEGKTVKITGYVSGVEDNVIVTSVNTAETVVHIGNSASDGKCIVSGSSADLNVRKQINNLKSGQKISIVGVINKSAQPIELNDIKIIVEQEDNKVDEIAKDLFEKGSKKIRETGYTDYYQYESAQPVIEKTINGVTYQKRNVLYANVEKEYSEIFTGDALKNVLGKRFAEVDGYLYVSYGGATGWDVTNIKVSRVSENNNEIKYTVTYNDVSISDAISEEKSCEMTVKLVDGNYRISKTNYCNIDE